MDSDVDYLGRTMMEPYVSLPNAGRAVGLHPEIRRWSPDDLFAGEQWVVAEIEGGGSRSIGDRSS